MHLSGVCADYRHPVETKIPTHGPDADMISFLTKGLMCAKNPVLFKGRLAADAVAPTRILSVSKKEPDKKMQYNENAIITPNDRCSMFNFELDSRRTFERHCTMIFSFAAGGQLRKNDVYKYEGPKDGGHFDFHGYNFNKWGIEGETTWNNQPDWKHGVPNPPPRMKQGYSYVISSAPCGVEKDFGWWKLSVIMCATDATFIFPQKYDSCPLGFYVILSDKPPKLPANQKRDVGYPWGHYAAEGRRYC